MPLNRRAIVLAATILCALLRGKHEGLNRGNSDPGPG
jgi:hypothetical protein